MKNGNENKSTPSNSNPADSPSKTTVIIASPVVENCKLAIAVKNSKKRYELVGEFQSFFEISRDLHIFKGIFPNNVINGGLHFKFVYVNSEDQNKIAHKSRKINRKQKSINDSWIFYFFKLPQRYEGSFNINTKLKESVNELNKTNIKKQIASKFFVILFEHIGLCDEVLSEKEWDDAYESWHESLHQMKFEEEDTSDGFQDFLNTWIDDRTPNLKINFDQLFLLVVGAYFMEVNFEKMRKIFEDVSNSKEFSLYLHKSIQCQLRPEEQYRLAIFNNIVEHGGRKFLWIFFRLDVLHRLENYANENVTESIIETLKDIPEVLLDDTKCASRVVNYLVRCSNDIDELYGNLRPTFDKHVKYQQLLHPYLLKHFLTHRRTVEDLIKFICSTFMQNMHEMAVGQETNFRETIKPIFDHKKLTDLIQLALDTPDYLLPVVKPVIKSNVSQELEKMATFSSEEYDFFLLKSEKNERFNHFPEAKKKIEDRLLKIAIDHVKLGYFQKVKSVKLILLALIQTKIPFHDCSNVRNIKKAMDNVPRKFFQNLYSVLNNLKVPLETLEQYRKGDTRQMVIYLERHFNMLKKLKENIQERKVPLIDFPILQDSQVLDLLKTLGLTELEENELFKEFDELKERQRLYGHLLLKCSHSAAVKHQAAEIIQILDSKEWEKYLEKIDSEKSLLTLEDAMKLQLSLEFISAQWLSDVMESTLFIVKVWLPMIKSLQNYPLCSEDLQGFVNECAAQWKELARKVADGTASFKEMDEIISRQPNSDFLSQRHLQSQPIDGVLTAYQNFKNLKILRHVIGPFVSALRLFLIKDKKTIDNLHEFVEKNLLKNWDSTTLRQTTENGILKVMNEDLQIDSERPETQNTIQFISSLVTTDGTTDGNESLIKWLREKEEKDMEAMGKVLQGNLLEAYGQLQTLRTKTAPFLLKEFDTLHDLLREVRKSEERFVQCCISGRLQTIECKWLINMLPAIEAAVRASIISPSEYAKEKLGKLHQVVIEPKNKSYSIEIHLKPNGSLSMEELKQAFQLFDMTLMDHDTDEFGFRTSQNVKQIEQLSEVFELLFASGCNSYTFNEKIVIELADLDKELGRLREQLEKWNNQWEEMEKLPLLALFSRGYLLQLADLIGRNKTDDVVSILQILLPSAASIMGESINKLVQQAPRIGTEETWLSTAQLFEILRHLHQLIEDASHQRTADLINRDDPALFLVAYGQTLKSYFNSYTTVAILNVPRELLVGSALAAYASLTQQLIEPSRILFVTTNTDKEEIERFMKLWSVAKFIDQDIFIIVHVERLTAACAIVVREGVERVLPERRAKLLLLAQHQHRIQSTKSLGARLGLVSDRLLNINFTADQLRECLSTRLPIESNHLYFYTSKLPGCGKSQQVLRKVSELKPIPDYYRICVRTGTVEELMTSLKSIKIADESGKRAVFLHLDVAHSVSLEFNDILLSLYMNGALYDPQNAKLGYWIMSPQTSIAVEFASPFGMDEFPIIAYLGQHHICECEKSFFTYQLAEMPRIIGQPVTVNLSDALIVAGKFLQLKQQAGEEGLCTWDDLCSHPENITNNPLAEEDTFDLLVDSFQHCDDKKMLVENRNAPTFSALNAMASFLHHHICVMIRSVWFNLSAVNLFLPRKYLAPVFKQNIFDFLLKVANDCITRCWSVVNQGKKLPDMDWKNRQRAMLLLGRSDMHITGVNIVGRDAEALKAMFHPDLLDDLQRQGLQFQEFRGFQNLVKNQQDAEEDAQLSVILNATRSLFLLDGTTSSIEKVKQLDKQDRNTTAMQRLHGFIAQDQGYVLTGDNITKMMFALYRIRCGLPVIVFGETGVGKTALFRFLIQTFLEHTFEVCNVNSGTTIQDVEEIVQSAVKIIKENPKAEVFLLLDELNTADAPVIAFIKELMLDRHCHGSVLPENLHLIGAANPYRFLHEADKEAAVGLAFRFAQSTQNRAQTDGRNLVYRVNELPLAFYDHIYDFGNLSNDAEDIYIDEIGQHGLPKTILRDCNAIKLFTDTIKKSHRVARAFSVDPDSAVSLRDAARAVQLFNWFYHSPASKMLSGGNVQKSADLTVYLVYAFRSRNRKIFLENIFGEDQSASENMTNVSRIIAKMLYDKAHGASIGSGAIALNDALCENLFALYVCVLNGIFLIIVGRPGSSKSLSVEILKLVLCSDNFALRQELGDLPALRELYFQCSPMSTSSGFKALFESAQRLSVDPKTMLAMVVLDELGLADISPEKPIKVLHSELERQSFLTSGEKQQSPYSVVALSNWVVDAAQVNRGILILRTQADRRDLLESAKQLTVSLIDTFARHSNREQICRPNMKTENLEIIVNIYHQLDENEDIGGGYFFSMRDFFFCVKNYVCSVLESSSDLNTSQELLVQAAIRNFGGHEKAREVVKMAMMDNFDIYDIPENSSLDLIAKNILDSSKPESIHIARHLMVLNRSLIGLQLLNRHVKIKLGENTNWNVLFGSCFPGDLQVAAVTRKLRQVEQAIRAGGVIVLVHADQLFESLYMVLNQQYWTQGGVTMTQIALGPSIRAIALPSGPFRIIALQDTDVALNRNLMSPAILSRFEKHELRPSHLLNAIGVKCRRVIDSHLVWLAVQEEIKRQNFIRGYHEESFASLALHLQERIISGKLEQDEQEDQHFENSWMRSINPMAMIKLERDFSTNNPELKDVCQRYRNKFVLESLDDALQNIESNRMVIMTNTQCHVEIIPSTSQHSVIQLFEIQSELELVRRLESITARQLNDPGYSQNETIYCLIVQYDAVSGPIQQFQLAKYEVEQRFQKSNCRVAFIVHVDPRPVNMHWVFSFGDDWDYLFVDEVVRALVDQHQLALKELVQSPTDQPVSGLIEKMSVDSFKSLLFEMLGPDLQTNLACLHSCLGQFYTGMRTALGLPDNLRLVKLLKECLLTQLNASSIIWNIAHAVADASFDSSSSLTKGLWGVFKQKISNSLAHLLLVSDVWRVSDQASIKLWCDCVEDNYSDRLISPSSSDSVVQMPIGFRLCTQPLGRLLASLNNNQIQNINQPLQWLLNRLACKDCDQGIKQAYFLDCFLLRIHPHLHSCLKKVPLSKMGRLVDSLFENAEEFFRDWEQWEAKVIATLELVSIVSFAKPDTADVDLWKDATTRIRSWESFTKLTARLSLTKLGSPDVMKSKRFIMAVSSIENSNVLMNLLDSVEDLAQLLLTLRITKRILLFDPESEITLPELLLDLTPEKLFDILTELVINSVIRPRVASQGNLRQANLYTLLKSTSACSSPEQLAKILGECPTNNSVVLLEENVTGTSNNGCCSSCKQPLTVIEESTTRLVEHLRAPNSEAMESLFRDLQKFMFFFERVAELFIQQRKNNPDDAKSFFRFLLSSGCRLRLSWRFLTVIVRSVLSTGESKPGTAIIDEVLSNIKYNRPTRELNVNANNLLLALLVCFDQDIQNTQDDEEVVEDLIQAAMTGHWNVQRIRKLGLIRRQLAANKQIGQVENIITKWSHWRKNQTDQSITDPLLFFILRFCSAEGDEMRLGNIFRNRVILNELCHHTIINDYIKTLSPLSLGFTLQSADLTANPFNERLLEGYRFDTGDFEHYHLLVDLQPDWAPFIARLAYHAFDIFAAKGICLLREMASNLDAAAHFILPGIENHPYLPSFERESDRWYVCSCGTLCCLGDCGNPVAQSICVSCRVALGHNHELRRGVRKATAQDFQLPRGIFVTRQPSRAPTSAVRNCSPVVSRFALLLNSLALINAALNPQITPQVITRFLQTLPSTERQQNEDRRSFIQLLSNHIVVHLDVLCQLLVTSRPHLTMTDKFRIGHLLLHKSLDSRNTSLFAKTNAFRNGPQAREAFEQGLAEVLNQQLNLAEELDHIAGQSSEASKAFRQSLSENETSHWAYARRVFANQESVQLELARNGQLRLDYPFLDFVLDENSGMRKLNALQHLGEAMRFIALVRTVLSGKVTQGEAYQMSIAQGLEKMTEIVMEKGIILDRGRTVTSRDHVMKLFDGFKQLWDRFSQLENAAKKTFLDYFECQQVDINVRPKTVLDQAAPLILICASTEPPEATFSCQLLDHAVEAASSIARTNFIQPHCRKDSGRVRLSCSSAAALADFDESLYAHVSTEEVDRFIRDHVIDISTLPLAESFARAAILGSVGSTIAEELSLEVIPDFKFKDDVESGNFMVILERRSLAWQPSPIPSKIQELILADLEKNRSLAEARSVLISAITHLYSNTEPLIITKIRNNYISDVLEELLKDKILTELHLSEATKIVLNRHLKLEVCHAFGLLKAITFRMKGVDGRVPDGWTTKLSETLAQETRKKLLAEPGGGILETLLLLVDNVASESVQASLMPDESLLIAIREVEGAEWNGIPAELKMKHLDHVLRIAESLPKT